MTAERVAEIRARADAATPGPWPVQFWPGGNDFGDARWAVWLEDGGETVDTERREDADFIANSREDVPWLLDQLAAATARAQRAEDLLDCVAAGAADRLTEATARADTAEHALALTGEELAQWVLQADELAKRHVRDLNEALTAANTAVVLALGRLRRGESGAAMTGLSAASDRFTAWADVRAVTERGVS